MTIKPRETFTVTTLPSERLKRDGWGILRLQDDDGCRCLVGSLVDSPNDYQFSEIMRRARQVYGAPKVDALVDAAIRVAEAHTDPMWAADSHPEDYEHLYATNDRYLDQPAAIALLESVGL